MQKWEKYLLIILFILGILGSLIGFTLTKSGIGNLEIFNNIDIFSFLELFLLALANACAIFDIYETYEGRNELGPVMFNITLSNKDKLRYVLIFLIFINIFEFGVFLYSPDAYIPPLLCMTMLLTFIIAFHNKAGNVIGENGVLHWGIYYSWEDIESLNIETDTLLKVNLINVFFAFEYTHIVKFDFTKSDKEELKNFLDSKLQASIDKDFTNMESVQVACSEERTSFTDNSIQPDELTNEPSLYTNSSASKEQSDSLSVGYESELSNNIEQCDDSPNKCDESINNIEQLFNNINQYEKLLRNIDQCRNLILP
ncbi:MULTISPECIES: DUF986 family protein [unclassified Clostridium]|uniref:DUF986 family protein n=1 Tax=unclassified Clostridium TaxID=2614128 RepID=UPI0002986CC9|nr:MULTISPECIES: DUF986 family protein [unclassified Clostridium]EKQ51593.1 MAG: Protein of unknown function (DUF986) [Clostridium sp. Maddingley MBC34-26]